MVTDAAPAPPNQADGRLWSAMAAGLAAFGFANWIAILFERFTYGHLPRVDVLLLEIWFGVPSSVTTFLAIGVLWSIGCCRGVSDRVSVRRAVLVTANAFWFVSLPFFLVLAGCSLLDVREQIGLTPVNSHLWKAALWGCTIGAAGKALQHEAKAPEVFAVLFVLAGYGVLIILRIAGHI